MLKNVASQKIGCQMVSATDGSAFTGAVTVAVTGDAGTQATGSVGSGACTHEGNGYHTYAPAQAETNYDLVAFTFTGTGAVPVTVQVYTLPTTGILAPTTAGRTLTVESDGMAHVDVKEWGGSTTPVTNLSTVFNTDFATNYNTTLDKWNVNIAQVGGNDVVVGVGTVAFPAEIASRTNITGGTITTVTNLTNLPSIPNDWITAAGIAADAFTAAKFPDATWQELIELFFSYNATGTYSGAAAGSLVKEIADNAGGAGLTLADIADAVWDEDLTGHTTADTAGQILGDVATGTPPTAAAIADAVWDEATAGHVTTGTFGKAAADILEDTATTIPGTISTLQTSVNDVPTNAEFEARTLVAADYFVVSDYTAPLDAAGVRTAVGLASANLDTQLADIPTVSEFNARTLLAAAYATAANQTTIIGYVDDIGVAGAGLTAIPWNASWDAEVQSEVTDALTTALTEAYRTAGSTGSVAQLLYEISAHLGRAAIASTTKTLKRVDGTTTAKTFTLDSATTPTSITEAT